MAFNIAILNPLFALGLFLGTAFPDIDEPESWIGQKFKFLSFLIIFVFILFKILLIPIYFLNNKAYKNLSHMLSHRGITHFLILPIILFCISLFFTQIELLKYFIQGFALGCLLHQTEDMLTAGGIKGWLWPVFPSARFTLLPSILRFKVGGISELVFIVFLLFINVYILFHFHFQETIQHYHFFRMEYI